MLTGGVAPGEPVGILLNRSPENTCRHRGGRYRADVIHPRLHADIELGKADAPGAVVVESTAQAAGSAAHLARFHPPVAGKHDEAEPGAAPLSTGSTWAGQSAHGKPVSFYRLKACHLDNPRLKCAANTEATALP